METDHQLRVLYLYQILLRHSDVDHPVSTKELIDMMETYHQIKLHRTTITSRPPAFSSSMYLGMVVRCNLI